MTEEITKTPPEKIRETALASGSVLLNRAAGYVKEGNLEAARAWQDAANVLTAYAATIDMRPEGFHVVLNHYGEKKISVIKALRTLFDECGYFMGLKDAKTLVESYPIALKVSPSDPSAFQFTHDMAERAAQALREAGAKVEVRKA